MNNPDIDASIAGLVRVLNDIAGVETIGSCGGHAKPKGGQWPADRWYITFRVEKTDDGWLSLEFLAWAINREWRRANERGQVILYPDAPPPFFNEPGEVLHFALEGHAGASAEELATHLGALVTEYFTEVEPVAGG